VLRTNLSSRPFYNERAVHVVIGAIAVVVMAATAFNVTRVVALSRQNTELSGRITRDQAEAQRLTREALSIRRGINKEELELVAGAAREANELIDQRTFSWTAFFNYIEVTMPPDVMLVAVRPSVKNQQTRVSMTVVARRTEDIDEFVEKLEATGAFNDVYPAQADPTDQGLQRSVLESVYTGPGTEADADAAAPADAATPTEPPKPDAGKTGPSTPGPTKPELKPDPAKPPSPKPPAGGRQ
jgi:Tfp pilus assembly protein PilN